MSWWDMVTPREEEMPGFLNTYIGKGKACRTPKRRWEDLWTQKRGEMNHIIGVRKFKTITNRKGPKYQRGIICAAAFGVAAGGGTTPALTTITHDHIGASGAQRIHIVYFTDGDIRWEEGSITIANIVYAQLTTDSDDANDHTSEWWPDNPETNIGLSYEIQLASDTGTNAFTHIFKTAAGANRNVAQWYNLDTVSDDSANASQNGSLGVSVIGKDPASVDSVGSVEIGLDGTSSSLASHTVDIFVSKT